jgi:hypothetical protein
MQVFDLYQVFNKVHQYLPKKSAPAFLTTALGVPARHPALTAVEIKYKLTQTAQVV